MNNEPLSLESQFEVKRLKLHLQKYPSQSIELAIAHFEDYLQLVQEYKKLEQQKKSPSLPPIPSPSYQRLQAEYDDLLQEYKKLLMTLARLQQENQDLIELASALSDDNAPIPSFLRGIFNV